MTSEERHELLSKLYEPMSLSELCEEVLVDVAALRDEINPLPRE